VKLYVYYQLATSRPHVGVGREPTKYPKLTQMPVILVNARREYVGRALVRALLAVCEPPHIYWFKPSIPAEPLTTLYSEKFSSLFRKVQRYVGCGVRRMKDPVRRFPEITRRRFAYVYELLRIPVYQRKPA